MVIIVKFLLINSLNRAKECIPVGNGTDALEVSLEALELPIGSEILVPINTFVGTVEAIIRSGLKPVFCKFDEKTLNICVNDAQKMISSKTSAIMAVHLYGRPAAIQQLRTLCDNSNLFLVEDCAQAHLASVGDQFIGTFGDVAAFSFYPGKNLGAFGDAGAIITNCENLAKRAKLIANHGRIKKYDHEMVGRNSRMDELQAAILNVKLDHLASWTEQRRENAEFYYKELSNCKNIILPTYSPGNVYHLFPVISSFDRNLFRKFLRDQNIETGLHYPQLVTQFPAYAPWVSRNFDRLSELNSRIFTIPMHESMSQNELDHVCNKIRKFCDEIPSPP